MANAGLGRGLDSLIPKKRGNVAGRGGGAIHIRAKDEDAAPKKRSVVPQSAPASTGQDDRVLKVEIGKIAVNPMQPRKNFSDAHLGELVDSVKEHGIVQPLIVSRKGDRFELIAGERRLRAAREAGLEKVPVILRQAGEKEKLAVALIENVQRENLNSIELGQAYKKMMDEFDLTQEEVAKQMGKSRSSVANTLRMLNLPDEIQVALIKGKITEGHAKYLLGLDNEDKMMTLFRRILHNNLSVKDTNDAVKRMGGTKKARVKVNYRDKDKEFAFREFFGSKVEISRKGKGGKIVLEFFSDDELNEMVKKIK